MKHHLVLVGLPGSGKSTVGQLVAASLAVPLVDVDREIEQSEGCSIEEIFRTRGEPEFRQVESRVTERALASTAPAVIVPGGGWAGQPGNLETVRGRAIAVYLETSPETAARRVPAGTRPVLSGSDPLAAMRALYARREGRYLQAHHRISTAGRTAEQIAQMVVELANQSPGE